MHRHLVHRNKTYPIPLISFGPQQPFETYYVEIYPGRVYYGGLHGGNTYEVTFVMTGRAQFRWGQVL